jgi:photosystem II stability/assembly factor-like uncharacterized protein
MLLAALLAAALAGGWETHGPAPSVSAVAVAGPDVHRVYAIAGSVFRSDDGGETWLRIFDAPPVAGLLTSLAVDPRDPDRLFVATIQAGPRSHFNVSLYRSVDGGEEWTVRLGADAAFCSVAFDEVQPNTVYAAFWGRQAMFFRSEDGGDSFEGGWTPFFGLGSVQLQLARDGWLIASGQQSRDGGRTWGPIGFSFPAGCPVALLAIDPTNPNRIFVSGQTTEAFCSGVWRSLDGGVTWSRTTDVGGPVLDLLMDPSDPSWIYVAAAPVGRPARVLVTSDDGQSWQDLELPAIAGSIDLALTESGDRLYAATSEGVYARSLRRTRAILPRP